MNNNSIGYLNGVANEALTEYRFVDTAGTTAAEALKFSIADSTDGPVGIVTNSPASGDPAIVVTVGQVTLLEVDGSGTAIVAGDYLKPSAGNNGIGIKAATNNDKYGAIALEPSTAAGDKIRVLVTVGFIGAA